MEAARACGKPVVTMANYIEGFHYVGIDNYAAMTSVIDFLHDSMGLSYFWFAMGPSDNYESQVRTQALRDYCAARGLPCEDRRFYAESFIMECGQHAFERLYALHGGRLPQAVICANDQIAAGVCQAAEAAGLRVPRDLLVTGFDNLDISGYLSPSITTLDQLPWTMGETCVDTLCRIWQGEAVPAVINTPTRLILRESTGHADPSERDMKRNVTEIIARDSSTTEFSYRLSTLQYQLPGCETLEAICLALKQCLSSLDVKGLRLVLDRRLFDEALIGFDGDAGWIDTGDNRMPVEGYSDEMRLVFSWERGKEPRFRGPRVGSTLSMRALRGPRENYLFVPLHFMERTVGYMGIWNCLDLVRIKCVSALVNTLTMALRSFFDKRQLSGINRVVSGLSMADDLTGLHNRLGLQNLGARLYRQTCDKGGSLCVLFIDMDLLKSFNDGYGHAVGDQAILSVANAIRRNLPRGAVAARFGGDEFLALFPVQDRDGASRTVAAIVDAIPAEAAALNLPGAPGISAGFVLTDPEAGRPLDDYVAEADALMYAEKKKRHAAMGIAP